jgi:flagellar M-ring protein FliF
MNLSRLKDTWNGLEPRGQFALVGSALAVLATMVLLFHFASKPSYTTLASGLDPSSTGQATKALDSAGVSYKVAGGGTEIQVQSGQESQARIALAEKGVLNGGHVGFELFDKKNLGATDFQNQVDYQRALEGEIARTVEQIQGVGTADVQLVLPQESLFADQQTKATAAVLLTGGSGLDESTIRGIAHLTASSVKDLDPAQVTITDETGALLWPTADGGSGGAGASTKMQADSLYAAELSSQINAMLTSTLGAGKALARVHADLNVDETTVDKVTYGKTGVPVQAQTDNEQLNSKGGGTALPSGTSANTPPTYAAGSSSNGQSQYQHKTDNTTFGVDKTVEHSVVAPGTVNKLDVALVVDNSVPADTVAQLQRSVASLAGITPTRGDTIAVSRVTFAKSTTTTATASPLSKLGNPAGIAKDVGVGLLVLIFLFMMRRALKKREGEESVPEPTWLREIEQARPLAELEAGPARAALPDANSEARNAVKGEVEEIARNQPQAIAAQVSSWMKE